MSTTESTLTSKIQYNNFEPGEFVGDQQRNYEETIALIGRFPWEKQREKIGIDLTGPSVTIQKEETTFLKLSLFYNQKFVLQFFNGKDLYTKSFFRYEDAFDDIRYFIDSGSIHYGDFKKENTKFRSIQKHFPSKSFVYEVLPGNPFNYVDGETVFSLGLSVSLTLVALISLAANGLNLLPVLIIVLLVFPFFGGINLILLRSYHRFSQGMMLQLSKGAPSFVYGPIGNRKTYNKQDIKEIVVCRNSNSRCNWSNFSITTLHMKNGESITVTSLLLKGSEIELKMPGIPATTVNQFIPWLENLRPA